MAAINTLPNYIPKIAQSRRLIMLVIGFMILIFAISFVSANTLTRINLTGNKPTAELYAYDAVLGKQKKLNSLFGLSVIPRGSQLLLVKSEQAETLISLKDRKLPFIYGSLDVNLQEPQQSKLLSAGGQDCPLVIGTDVYSYDCMQPASFSKFGGTLGLPSHTVTDRLSVFTSGYQAARYKDGVIIQLVKRLGADGKLEYSAAYASPGKPLVSRKMPDNFYSGDEYILMVADRTNAGNSSVVVYNPTSGTGYYFKDFLNSANAEKFQRQHKPNPQTDQASCTLASSVFSCYYGTTGEESHETEEAITPDENGNYAGTGAETTEASSSRGVIETVDLSGSSPSIRSYRGPAGYGIDELYATSEGKLYSRSGINLDRLILDGDSFVNSSIASNSQIAAAGSDLYYVQDNKVYRYSAADSSSSLVYVDKQETISNLQAFGGQLFIMSYASKDPAQLLLTRQLSTGKQ